MERASIIDCNCFVLPSCFCLHLDLLTDFRALLRSTNEYASLISTHRHPFEKQIIGLLCLIWRLRIAYITVCFFLKKLDFHLTSINPKFYKYVSIVEFCFTLKIAFNLLLPSSAGGKYNTHSSFVF